MRGLFQSALALLTLGLGVIGCSRSGPPEESPNPANQKVEAPYQAAFHVPGMS